MYFILNKGEYLWKGSLIKYVNCQRIVVRKNLEKKARLSKLHCFEFRLR